MAKIMYLTASLYVMSTSIALAQLAQALNNDHPNLPLDPKHRAHLICPYADKWLAMGPEKAAKELGLKNDVIFDHEKKIRRKLQEEGVTLETMGTIMGSCIYTAPFAGESCMEFRGESWTLDAMQARCDQESSSNIVEGLGCDIEIAGYCVKNVEVDGAVAVEASAMTDCGMSKMACENFVGGTFLCVDAEEVAEESGSGGVDSSSNPFNYDGAASMPSATSTTDEDLTNKCILAPGAIGAAHQAGFSRGYSVGCPNTPAQGSPYMWPLKWAADFQMQSMAYGSDDILYTSRGRTFYSLDKNTKRSDTTFQDGTLRTIGQTPCDEEDIDQEFAEMGFLGCHRNQTTMSTMIHKGGMMYFIDWKNDTVVEPGETDVTKVEECTKINLAVIGNIRPDWFLDKRGDDTDTQYLGNQHVFYADHEETIPKLVKQWRKKDFASQYFVMSMMGNPKSKLPVENGEKDISDFDAHDTIHWPLILNIPGEGFGDDHLQVYRNHELLTDEHDELFMLIENYEASGGLCAERNGNMAGDDEGATLGPPVLEVYIPSNLEVDPNSWYSNEYTFSPFWVPAEKDVEDDSTSAAASGSQAKAVTEVTDRVTVESCFDENTNTVDLSIHFMDIEPNDDGLIPWLAVGYRPSEICSMTPLSGDDTPIILVTHEDGDSPNAHSTLLPKEAKSSSQDVFTAMIESAVPLENNVEYTGVSISAPMVSSGSTTVVESRSSVSSNEESTLVLSFKQTVDKKPEMMHLMYAIGMSPQLGFHTTRWCFSLDSFPSCPKQDGSGEKVANEQNVEDDASDDGAEDQNVNEVAADTASSEAAVLSMVQTTFAISIFMLAVLIHEAI